MIGLEVLARVIAAAFQGYPVTPTAYGIERRCMEVNGAVLWYTMIEDYACPADTMYGWKQ